MPASSGLGSTRFVFHFIFSLRYSLRGSRTAGTTRKPGSHDFGVSPADPAPRISTTRTLRNSKRSSPFRSTERHPSAAGAPCATVVRRQLAWPCTLTRPGAGHRYSEMRCGRALRAAAARSLDRAVVFSGSTRSHRHRHQSTVDNFFSALFFFSGWLVAGDTGRFDSPISAPRLAGWKETSQIADLCDAAGQRTNSAPSAACSGARPQPGAQHATRPQPPCADHFPAPAPQCASGCDPRSNYPSETATAVIRKN